MTAIVEIGRAKDTDGNPLVVVGGQVAGTVSWLREMLDQFEMATASRKPALDIFGANMGEFLVSGVPGVTKREQKLCDVRARSFLDVCFGFIARVWKQPPAL